jgi:hypothetical protein
VLFDNIKEEKDSFVKYHALRSEIRELLFLIEEQSLVVAKIPSWNKLFDEIEIMQINQYKTPFSFLVDFSNPIYAVNNYDDALWASLHISSEYIEYLTYNYPFLKKYWNTSSAEVEEKARLEA